MSPFACANLSALSYAQGFTLWHYRANVPTLAAGRKIPALRVRDVLSRDFFPAASVASLFAPGDMLIASCADGALTLYITSGPDGSLRYVPMQSAASAAASGEASA